MTSSVQTEGYLN